MKIILWSKDFKRNTFSLVLYEVPFTGKLFISVESGCLDVESSRYALVQVVMYNFLYIGAMGKRTRFQVDDKAQLLLKVTRDVGNTDEESGTQIEVSHSSASLPKVCVLLSFIFSVYSLKIYQKGKFPRYFEKKILETFLIKVNILYKGHLCFFFQFSAHNRKMSSLIYYLKSCLSGAYTPQKMHNLH